LIKLSRRERPILLVLIVSVIDYLSQEKRAINLMIALLCTPFTLGNYNKFNTLMSSIYESKR